MMKLRTWLILAAAVGGCEAIHKPNKNFRIVLDSKSPRGPSIGFRSNTNMDFDAKAIAKKFQEEAKDVVDKVVKESTKIVERVQSEAKDFLSNLKHYSKAEIGLYTALALSLTLVLKGEPWKSCLYDLLFLKYLLTVPFFQPTSLPVACQRLWTLPSLATF